jgi:hypothetical protein
MTRKGGDILARTEAFKRPTVAAWSSAGSIYPFLG